MSSAQPWRRGTPTSNPTSNRQTQSIWANPTSAPPSNRGNASRCGQGIARDGFRMARKDLGGKRENDEMNLLLSPSRGIQDDDPDSLKNPHVQERFRDHITEKLKKWSQTHPVGSRSVDQKRRDEELGIILLDLRKLREGITSIRRIDTFACEVYQASALLSLVASNQAQLSSSLPHLVTVLHPALAAQKEDDVSSSLAALSISSRTSSSPPRPPPATRSFYLVLHLLHSHLLPAFASSTASSNAPLSTFLPALHSLLSANSVPLPPSNRRQTAPGSSSDPYLSFLLNLHQAFLQSSFSSVSTLLSTMPSPPSQVSEHLEPLLSRSIPNPLALLLKDSIPILREQYWKVIEKTYKFPPDGFEWLSKWLLFEFQVRLERDLEGSQGAQTEVAESWDENDEGNEEDDRVEKEAKKRTVIFVKGKKGLV